MNHKINTRCRQLIKEYAELPEASESLKQRILIAANRARNRQRYHKKIAPLVCSLMVMFIVVANYVNQPGTISSGGTESLPINQMQESSVLVSLKPITEWNKFNNENEFVDTFIRHRSWQTSLFRKPITRL
jgi:hypothetical protein